MRGISKELPQGWIEATIGDLTIDKVPQAVPSSASLFTYIDISGIDNESKQITPKQLPGDQAPSRARQLVRAQDVLVSMTRPNLNAVAIVPDGLDNSIASTGLDVLRAIEIEPRWLFSHVRSQDFVREMTGFVQGALYPAIKSSDVRSYCIPVPPLNEQNRIVARIEELQVRSQRAREALETIPDLLEQLRQSLLAAAFSGNLTKEWRKKNPDVEPASELLKSICTQRRKRWEGAELKKLNAKGLTGENLYAEFGKRRKQYNEEDPVDTSNLPALPEGWIWESMERICEKIMDGAHHSPPNGPAGDRIYLTAKNVRPWNIDMSNLTYVSEKDHSDIYSRCDVKYRDVLYVKDGVNAGMAALNTLKEPFSLLSSVGVFRPEDGILPEYVVSYLNSPVGHRHILSMISGNAITRLTLTKLKSAVIPVPPLKEQQKISFLLDQELPKVKSLEIRIGNMISDLQIQDQAVLAKAFRGELVPHDPNDEPAPVLLERIREEKTRKAAEQRASLKKTGKKMKQRGTPSSFRGELSF